MARQRGEPSLSAVTVGYKPKVDLPDECRPLCLSRGQFMHCFYRGAAVRARSDDAAEHRRDRDRNDRRIKLDCTDQPGDENHAAACHGDPPGQDEFAAALDPGVGVVSERRMS
jgi:hypothetical protein